MAPGSLQQAATAIGAHHLLHMLHALYQENLRLLLAIGCIDVTFFPQDNAKSFVSFMVILLPTLIITLISFTLILNWWTTLWLEMIQETDW
jgi:hypothetical protein